MHREVFLGTNGTLFRLKELKMSVGHLDEAIKTIDHQFGKIRKKPLGIAQRSRA